MVRFVLPNGYGNRIPSQWNRIPCQWTKIVRCQLPPYFFKLYLHPYRCVFLCCKRSFFSFFKQKILEDINFILHLSHLLDILGLINHCNCCLQGPGSNIVDFTIKLTTLGVGKVRLASHMWLFDPQDVAL